MLLLHHSKYFPPHRSLHFLNWDANCAQFHEGIRQKGRFYVSWQQLQSSLSFGIGLSCSLLNYSLQSAAPPVDLYGGFLLWIPLSLNKLLSDKVQLLFRAACAKLPSCCLFLEGFRLEDDEHSAHSRQIVVDDAFDFVLVFLFHVRWLTFPIHRFLQNTSTVI